MWNTQKLLSGAIIPKQNVFMLIFHNNNGNNASLVSKIITKKMRTYGFAFQLSSCTSAHGLTFPVPQSAGRQPCEDARPSAGAAAQPQQDQFHEGVCNGWQCVDDLSERLSRSVSVSWRSSLPSSNHPQNQYIHTMYPLSKLDVLELNLMFTIRNIISRLVQ